MGCWNPLRVHFVIECPLLTPFICIHPSSAPLSLPSPPSLWLLQEREDPTLTEWDRFARAEYIRLSMEDEGEEASNGSAEVWDESLEAPF